MQLKEEKARVILERQVNEDRGSAFSRVSSDYEKLRTKHTALEEEAASLRTRVRYNSNRNDDDNVEKWYNNTVSYSM